MEIEHINPKGIYEHPNFTRIVTVKGPMKLILIAGQTPSDEEYKCVAPGDYRAQYVKVMENLEIQLDAAGATWDDVVYKRVYVLDVEAYKRETRGPDAPVFGNPDKPPPPSTLIGVTELADPEFLVEIDLVAVTEE